MFVPLTPQYAAPTTVGGLGSIDLSTLSWEDYLLGGIGLMAVFYLANPGHGLFTAPIRKKKSRKSSSGGGLGFVFPMLLVGGAFLGYLYLSQNSTGS